MSPRPWPGTDWDWGLSPQHEAGAGTADTSEYIKTQSPVRHCVWLGFTLAMCLPQTLASLSCAAESRDIFVLPAHNYELAQYM